MIKWADIQLGVSPLTNSIYIGKSKPMKGRPDISEWTDRSGDMTEKVMFSVIEWFFRTKEKEYSVKTGKKIYRLKFETEETE